MTTRGVRERAIEAYRNLQKEVAAEEENGEHPSDGDLPPLHSLLDRPPRTWQDREKALRTVPVATAMEEHLDHALEDWKIQVMTGLDAYINTADDSIDSRPESPQELLSLEFNKAQALRMAYESIPDEYRNESQEAVSQYLTNVYSIPGAEPVMVNSIRQNGADDIKTAAQLYNHQAQDIDGFTEVAATGTELGSSYERLKQDFRTCRAHQLLFDDVADIQQDLDDGDDTAVIALAEKYPDPEALSDCVRQIYDEFAYSVESGDEYRRLLRDHENRPANLEADISHALGQVQIAY